MINLTDLCFIAKHIFLKILEINAKFCHYEMLLKDPISWASLIKCRGQNNDPCLCIIVNCEAEESITKMVARVATW
jgi:hypothetical protein